MRHGAPTGAEQILSQHPDTRYQTLIESLLEGLIVHRDGRVVYVNPAAARMFGYDAATELIGVDLLERLITPDARRLAADRIASVLAGEIVPIHPGIAVLKRDGEPFLVSAACARIDWDGEPAVASLCLNVTEQRALEIRLFEIQKRESLGLLAGSVAHEFNNLLTSVLGYTDLAASELPNGCASEQHLKQVTLAAQRGAGLARQLLDCAGHSGVHRRNISAEQLLAELADLIHVSIPRTCRVQYRIASPTPWLKGDPVQLRQAICNLVINAGEAIGERAGVVSVEINEVQLDRQALRSMTLGESAAPGRFVAIAIGDTGAGIPSGLRARIFDPFFTTKFVGRGLGLAAVLGITRAHGGAIAVESSPQAGTRMTLYIPSASDQLGSDATLAARSPDAR